MAKKNKVNIVADMLRHQSVTEYLHEDYKDYAVYTILERAIPSFVDGMKPVQRKIFATASKFTRISKYADLIMNHVEYREEFYLAIKRESIANFLTKFEIADNQFNFDVKWN